MPKIHRPPQPYDHAAWLRDVDYWIKRDGGVPLGSEEDLFQLYLLGASAREAANKLLTARKNERRPDVSL